ncbi:MAG: redox-regulated ATPase YchF [Candidatus Latescibacteria bacterium]|jgi:ribosome-binding ATPase|nr:redox-regulated ATPase YchF [Candidatus Latescibacterota bacterium]
MKLGLVGLPQVGKRTLFSLLTGQDGDKVNIGLAKVRDARFEKLVEMFQPKKETPAQMEFMLLPDMDTDASRNAETLKGLEQVDVICYLARVFEDDTVFHVEGDVNARRDVQALWDELILSDQIFVEKRLERLAKEKRPNDVQRAAKETELMTRMQTHLEDGRPLSQFDFSDEDQKLITSYPFLTMKALMVVLNVGEDQLGDDSLVQEVSKDFVDQGFKWIAISAQIEDEVSQLDDEERISFLEELGIEQPALDRLTLLCYETLGLMSYFTVGEDEVRAWTIRQGALAPVAGGVIHGDIERGFIRAEVMQYDDLMELGSEQKVKAAGKFVQKGRDAVIDDGDIIHFLFKV